MNDESDKNKRTWLERLALLLTREPQNREQLMGILRDAEERGILSADSLSMIERGLQVTEMQVREIMIPKSQMVVVEKDSSAKKIFNVVIESGHSRFPVFDPHSKDVVGLLLAKDILKHCNQKLEFHLNQLIRPVTFIPQNKRLDVLLREFRVNHNHLAIVLDEYGHVAGLVTIEDVLEQIVGDIEDEYDTDEENGHIKKLTDGGYIVKGSTEISDFNAYFHADFQGESHTLGKFILTQFDHVPQRGETITLSRWRFKILHSDNRRIYLLEVRVLRRKKEKAR